MNKLYKGQVIHTREYDNFDWEFGLVFVPINMEETDFNYRVFSPFVQLSYYDYSPELRHLKRNNLMQEISKNKFFNCIYRDGAEDYDEGVYISEKFGKRSVVLNKELTHCYFSYKGKFFKSKIWVDKLGVIYGACAGSEYGVYDK